MQLSGIGNLNIFSYILEVFLVVCILNVRVHEIEVKLNFVNVN